MDILLFFGVFGNDYAALVENMYLFILQIFTIFKIFIVLGSLYISFYKQ